MRLDAPETFYPHRVMKTM